MWVAGEKAQPSSGHMREKIPIMSFRGHEDLSYCTKSDRMSGMLVSGKKNSITVSIVWRHWWHPIPNIAWDVGHSFNLYVGLQRPGWLYVLRIPPRADVRLWTPISHATDLGPGPNLRAGSGRAPCVPRSLEERPAAGREKIPKGHKKTFIPGIYCLLYTSDAADE